MDAQKKYYVYKWIIVDTKEVFYIGKGCGYRYKTMHNRNKFFMDIYNTHNCQPIILCDRMTEYEAFELEKLLIYYYRHFTHNRLTNVCDGGEGVSGHKWTEEEKKEISKRSSGVNNGNYGNYWSDEQKKHARDIKLGKYDGENNPNAHRVICIETGEVFGTMSEAARFYGLKCSGSIHHAIHYPNGVAAGLHWAYI